MGLQRGFKGQNQFADKPACIVRMHTALRGMHTQRTVSKLQIPNPKSQTNPENQIPTEPPQTCRRPFETLEFGISLGFGIWDLEF
jgi:hypothetical protein